VPKLVQTKLISATPIQPEPTITTAASVPDLPNQVVHIVQHKETLYSIARKYEVSLAEIQQWNKLQGYDLKEGMQLVIQKNKTVGTSSR
jgi:LysM repeat protein